MSFRALIRGVFDLPDGRVCVEMTEIEGLPAVGDCVRVGQAKGRVVALGKNSTDGEPVSTRACLTGQAVAPYGAIAVKWKTEPVGNLHMQRIEGTSDV